MFKAKKARDYLQAVRRIQAAGIMVNGCFILGLDEQGPEVFAATWEFLQTAPLFDVQLAIMTPFPGTPLYQRLLREGRLLYPCQWERYALFEAHIA
ncbi:MAG: hypothetical protein RMJ82_12045 [Gemmatales bacterium]|nr:hypothetical protein [Gemmatales bacterium]